MAIPTIIFFYYQNRQNLLTKQCSHQDTVECQQETGCTTHIHELTCMSLTNYLVLTASSSIEKPYH